MNSLLLTKINLYKYISMVLLMSHVGERPWWPIQSPNKGRQKKKRKAKRRERDQIKFIDLRF